MSVLVHDVIKANYSRMGYLPDYPHHLISDREMINAFLHKTELYSEDLMVDEDLTPNLILSNYEGYLIDTYIRPMFKNFDDGLDGTFSDYEVSLISCIHELVQFMMDLCDDACNMIVNGEYDDSIEFFPDWVYSYMLGEVIGPRSKQIDKHDLFVLLDTDNLNDTFDVTSAYTCLNVSKQWLKKLVYNDDYYRPPTCFGEPHVLKSLRLTNTT